MKKLNSILRVKSAFYFLIATVIFLSCNNNHQILPSKDSEEQENDMYDEAAAAQQFEFERTKDPVLGYVPKERLLAAYEYAEQSKQIAMRSRITAGTWIERGPTGDVVGVTNGNKRYGGGTAISSGRIRAVWVDLNDATGNTVWIGGVDGGLWNTTNFKTPLATWNPVNDFFTNLSISSICQDPVNKNIMYFCTGEAYLNFDAVRGNGVFKSIDNGATWSPLVSTATFINCSKILCDASGNIYLGTLSSGFLRSTKASGGISWTTITPTGLATSIADFEISSSGRLHLSVGLGTTSIGGYRFTDIPSTVTSGTWTSATTAFPFSSGAKCRVELACSGNTLYALPGNTSGQVTAIYKSTNGGVNWLATATSPSNTGNYGFSNNQAWYCLAADINPADVDNVIVGSLNCYGTTDGGNTWTQLSDWSSAYSGAGTGQYVHADQQIIKWYANDEVLIGSDGGIFYSADAGVSFEDRNLGLNIKQFFSCDYHPTLTNYFLAGAQDNGCHQFSTPGLNTTTEILGGDGAIVHIDQDEPNFQFGAYINNRYRRSTNDWSTSNSLGISAVNFYRSGTTSAPVDFGSYINPTDYDNTANIMYSGSDAGEFFRWSTAQTTLGGSYFFTSGSPAFPTGADIIAISNLSGIVSAVTVSPHTANRIYLGTASSKISKIDNAHTITTGSAGTNIAGATFPVNSTISCIAVGSTDNNLIATFSNYGISNIWISTNGGTSWTAIDGNLPDMPVRWAVFDPASDTKAWIATETGVWSTTAISGGSTVWAASPGFPTVRTDMIKYKAADQNLIAATHGRGLWTQSLASVLPINNFVLRGKWKNDATVELAWDYANNVSASFEIESSNNGTYFIKTGASQTNTNYYEQPASSDIYYRIKSKNIFGNVGYSNVVHLQKGVDTKTITGVKVFPNPVKNDIKIAFTASGKGIVHYQITGISGQVYWKKDEEISATGEYIREWNMQALKPGTYLLTVVYNNKKITQKFSKL
ncbi:MAG: T9SS type A sorting domain-containing protein [Chitinophagaceae bacterium]